MSERRSESGAGIVAAGARGSLALLLAINLFNYIDRYILAAVLPKIGDDLLPGLATDEKARDFKLGLLATAFLVSYMLIAPVFGWMGDRMRRWVIIGIGVIIWSLASGGSGFAATFGALLATRVFVGIGEAAYGPIAPTVIADLYPVSRRGAVLAWFYLAIPVGSALGYVLGGQVEAIWGWRAAFKVVVPPGLLLGVLCFFWHDPPRGQADAGPVARRSARLADYAVLLRTPSYVFNTIGMTAMTFAVGGIAYWMPKYIYRFRAGPDPDLASINTVFGAITVVSGLGATLLGGYLADRLRARWPGSYFTVSGVGMIIGFPLFLLVLVTPFPWAWGFVFLAVFMLFLNMGPTNTVLANVTHPAMRASAFAANILVIHLFGDALSPPLIGWITDRTGSMDIGFGVVSLTMLVGGVAWMLGAKHLARDTERAPTRLGSP